MSLAASATTRENNHWIWGDLSVRGAIDATFLSAVCAAGLNLPANLIFNPTDGNAVLTTLGLSVGATAFSALISRGVSTLEMIDSEELKKLLSTVAGVWGGITLSLSLVNAASIIYNGDILSFTGQAVTAALGGIGGSLLGRCTKGWGTALFNAGTSTALAFNSAMAISITVMPRYFGLSPIPTILALSSLIGHPYAAGRPQEP